MGVPQPGNRVLPLLAITKNHFLFNYVIGRGGFGKVWKVEKKKTKKLYAMKEMSKARIIAKRSVNSVMNERKLLSQLKHPYLVNMSFAFQDQKNLYLIMDLLSGGDLRYHLAKRKRFTEEQTRTYLPPPLPLTHPGFFIACIITSLEYLHNNGILHRDVKPENLIFDNRGTHPSRSNPLQASCVSLTSGSPEFGIQRTHRTHRGLQAIWLQK